MHSIGNKVYITGVICVTVLCLYIIGRGYWSDTRIRPIIVPNIQTGPGRTMVLKKNQKGGSSADLSWRNDMNFRIQHLRKGCQQSQIRNKYDNVIPKLREAAKFFQSKEHNISVCKVPKTGSTLLTIMFYSLTKDKSISKAFDKPRDQIHTVAGQKLYTYLNTENDRLTTNAIIVSREPYSRLFSGFIDKIHMSELIKSQRMKSEPYVTKAGNCGYNFSFDKFLDKVTTHILKGKSVNRHWRPIYSLCRMCAVDYNHVVKQETMASDMEYVINQLNISSDKKVQLTQIFHKTSADKTLTSLIKSRFVLNKRLTSRNKSSCSSKLGFFIKLWESLKIQGSIRSNMDFPLSSFRTKSLKGITKAVLTATHTNPLSSTERKAQRRQALVKAYTGVSKRIISQIQKAYKMDFYLFGYDINPPS